MKKIKRILLTITLLIAAVFFMNSVNLPAGNVQAASKGTYRAMNIVLIIWEVNATDISDQIKKYIPMVRERTTTICQEW